jgi:fatty acid desaturase
MRPAAFFRLLAFPFLACVGQWCWVVNFAPTNVLACAIWVPLLTYSWFCIGGFSHETAHGNFRLNKTLGEAIARCIGTLLGIPYTVYREVHMRHHAYLNTPLDWEMWPYSDPAASLRFRRVFLWFDVLLAIVVTPIIWGRICYSPHSPVGPEIRRTMRREYWAVAVFWLGAISTGIWAHRTDRFLFSPEHLIFALPPYLATVCNGFRKMMDHVGTSSFDPLHGTRTIVGANPLTKLLSYFNFDLAVHGPHHRYPKLDHSMLKQRMAEITEKNPEQDYPVFSSFFSAAMHTIRNVAKNPGVGVNSGCIDDISHLPINEPVTATKT